MSLLQTRLRWQQIVRSGRPAQLRLALLASFTANPLAPYLGVALEQAGLPADVWVGPYNQIAQECLSDASETARRAPDVLVVWPRLEELWGGHPLPLGDDPAAYAEEPLALAETCLDAARRWHATLLFVLPAVPEQRPLGLGDASMAGGVFASAAHAREALRRRLAGQRGVLLLDLEELVRALGSERALSPRMLALARIPFSEELFSAAGERLARLIGLSRRAPRRAVVLDSDNTLWGGAVGEEGAAGVDLSPGGVGEAFLDFQSFLLELRRAGVLLALASKNDEADVWQAFARREMRLRREHLSAWRIGWQPKSASLRAIAQELGLGVDSLVFIDDNPAEVAEVQAALPGVACIQMPADPATWLAALQASGALDRPPPTAEDLRRAQYYEQERRREEALGHAAAPEQYLAQLGVRARVFAPAPADLPRLAQLIAKTNQLNLNCRRRSERELAELCDDPRYHVRLVQVADRFGDYGTVGAWVARVDSEPAELDSFVLSCRALGRGVETAMVAALFEEAARAGRAAVVAAVEEHPRNEPARRFFADLGCAPPGAAPLRRPDWPAYIERALGDER